MENQESPVFDAIPAPAPAYNFVGDIGELFDALAKAQGEFSTIVTDSEADVQGKDGKPGYKFKYAGLDVVLAAVRPALSKHGLAVCQMFYGMGESLLTVLAFGEARIEVTCGLPEWKGAQGLGSAITYLKRYQLLSLLGVAPTEDDDGNAAMGNTAQVSRPRATPPTVKPAASQAAGYEGPSDAIKATIKGLASGIGFKGSELNEFSIKHGCGPLDKLNQAKAEVLAKLLDAQANPGVTQ